MTSNKKEKSQKAPFSCADINSKIERSGNLHPLRSKSAVFGDLKTCLPVVQKAEPHRKIYICTNTRVRADAALYLSDLGTLLQLSLLHLLVVSLPFSAHGFMECLWCTTPTGAHNLSRAQHTHIQAASHLENPPLNKPPLSPTSSSWVLTRTGPLISASANTLLNDQLLSLGPRPRCFQRSSPCLPVSIKLAR